MAPARLRILLLALLAAGLLGPPLGELLLRIVYDPPGLTTYDSLTYRRFRRGLRRERFDPATERRVAIRTNALGYRGGEPSAAPAAWKIAVLGDEFTAQLGLPEEATWVGQLAEMLSRGGVAGRPVEVWNFAVPRHHPGLQVRAFLRDVRPLRPDLVLHQVHVASDVLEGSPRFVRGSQRFFELRGGRLVDPRLSLARLATGALREHSRLVDFLDHEVLARLRGRSPRPLRDAQGGPSPVRSYRVFTETAPEWAQAWELFGATLRRLQAEVHAAGVPYLLVAIPAACEVDPGREDAIRRAYPALPAEAWDFEAPEKQLAALAATAGIELVSVHDSLRTLNRARDRGTSHLPDGGLLTAEGSRLVAQTLAKPVTRKLQGH